MYHQKNHLPVTDEVGKEIVSIPIHPNLKAFEIEKVLQKIIITLGPFSTAAPHNAPVSYEPVLAFGGPF